ncbi:MAG: thymidylate kinase [bacterium]
MEKGVFIVIDGVDGSGKATQTKLLVDRMKQEGLPIETISFPQYGKKSAGALEEYLAGAYGTADEVGPYRASVLFAVDRFDAAQTIRTWLDGGVNVVADRYVGSNMGHQGSKINDWEERRAFFTWEQEFEHKLLGIPRPDINVVLHVPTPVARELMRGRESKHGLAKDIHEANPEHLQKTEDTYLDMVERFDEFKLIECVENNSMLPPEIIHEKIWELLNNRFNLSK